MRFRLHDGTCHNDISECVRLQQSDIEHFHRDSRRVNFPLGRSYAYPIERRPCSCMGASDFYCDMYTTLRSLVDTIIGRLST